MLGSETKANGTFQKAATTNEMRHVEPRHREGERGKCGTWKKLKRQLQRWRRYVEGATINTVARNAHVKEAKLLATDLSNESEIKKIRVQCAPRCAPSRECHCCIGSENLFDKYCHIFSLVHNLCLFRLVLSIDILLFLWLLSSRRCIHNKHRSFKRIWSQKPIGHICII